MAYNLQQELIINQLRNDIGDLKRQMREIRSNQTNVLQYGNIIINGNTNQITFGSPVTVVLDQTGYIAVSTTGGVEIVRLDSSGITIKTQGDGEVGYIQFQKSGTNVAIIAFQQYTSGGADIAAMRQQSFESSASNRSTYSALELRKSDLTRDVFFEISVQYTAGVFTQAVLNFAKDGANGTLAVFMDDTSGHGWMTVPQRASDPVAAGAGAIYYSTGLNRFRVLDGLGWKTL